MKLFITCSLIVIACNVFGQQSSDQIACLVVDSTQTLDFQQKIESILNTLNKTDPDFIGKLKLADDLDARGYYSVPKLLKDNYYASVGAFCISFVVSNYNNTKFTDKKLLMVTVTDLRPQIPKSNVILEKMVCKKELQALIVVTLKHHLLKRYTGFQKQKSVLWVYDDGSHSLDVLHGKYFDNFFNDTLLMEKYYVDQVIKKVSDGRVIFSKPGTDNNFVYILNGVPNKELKVPDGDQDLPGNFENFCKYIMKH